MKYAAGHDITLCIGRSLPSRGAWIEIVSAVVALASELVAPLAGSVD